jgi:hypothetical protein
MMSDRIVDFTWYTHSNKGEFLEELESKGHKPSPEAMEELYYAFYEVAHPVKVNLDTGEITDIVEDPK